MKESGALSFDMFLHSFENMIIQTLAARNRDELARTKKPLMAM